MRSSHRVLVPSTMMWDVVVCEDFDSLRDSLRDYLQAGGQWSVRAVSDGQSLRQQLIERVPDILLLDVGLPGESGIDLMQWIRTAYPSVGVVMLSGRSSPSDRMAGWRAGADVYLVKPVDPEEVELALQAVMARSTRSVVPANPVPGPRLVVARRCLESTDGQCTMLTPRETMALQMLAQSPGVIVESNALREVLWPNDGDDMDYQNALFSLIRRVRRKLETAGLPADAISVIRGRGYCFNRSSNLTLVVD